MIIIAFLGESVKDYLDKYRNNSPSFPYTCPICGGCRTNRHGHFDRMAIDIDFDVELPIYRFLCMTKSKTISLLPSFLWPHRSYLTGVVEIAVILRVEAGLSWDQLIKRLNNRPYLVSIKTVKRWIKELSGQAGEVNSRLITFLLRFFPQLKLPPQSLTGDKLMNLALLLSYVRFFKKIIGLARQRIDRDGCMPVFSLLHLLFGVRYLGFFPQNLSLPVGVYYP